MENSIARLHLDDEGSTGEGEGWEIDLVQEIEEENLDLCLVGIFLTATTVNFMSMKTVLANIWHPLEGVTITDIGEIRFLFRFYCEADLARVVKGAPWTFNNHLLVFEVLKRGMIQWRLRY